MPNLFDLLLNRAAPQPPQAPPSPTQGMADTGLYGPPMWDREAQTSAVPPDIAEILGKGGAGGQGIAALRRLFTDPRFRASHGLIGSGVPLDEPGAPVSDLDKLQQATPLKMGR